MFAPSGSLAIRIAPTPLHAAPNEDVFSPAPNEAIGKMGKAPNEAIGTLGKAPNEANSPRANNRSARAASLPNQLHEPRSHGRFGGSS
jgi:hypothetical protein